MVLVHDGIGVWLAARRLNGGKFVWPRDAGATLTLSFAAIMDEPPPELAAAGHLTQRADQSRN